MVTSAPTRRRPTLRWRRGPRWRAFAARAVFAAALIASAPRLAAAEEAAAETTARARALFTEGLRLADRSQWLQAADRFRRSLALRESPAVRLNLASSLTHLGQDGEAADHLEALLAAPGTPANLRTLALRLLAQVEPRTARVTVVVTGAESAPAVALDGEALPAWRVEGQVHVDPGAHVVTVALGDRELERRELELAAGQLEEISVDASPPPPEPAPVVTPEPPPGPEVAPVAEPPRRRRWPIAVGVSAGVAVAAAVVLGVVFGVRAAGDDVVEGNMDPGVWRW